MSRARLVALAALVLTLAGPGSHARAASVTESGWWWRLQSSDLPLPAPPGIDEGDLLVQGAPDGAAAIAAIRFTMTSSETAPVLTIHLTDGSQGAADAIVLACPTNSFWSPGPNQPWSRKPVPASSCPAVGTASPDGTAITFDLAGFGNGPEMDVVLVPGRVDGRPAGADGSVFSLVIEQPAAGDVSTSPAAPPSSPTTGPTPTTAPSTGGQQAASLPSPVIRPSASAPTFVPALPAAETAAAPAPARASDTQLASTPALTLDGSSNRARGFAIALLAVLAAVGIAFARPELLASLTGRTVDTAGETRVGGIGRFARERVGEPPSLS